MEYSELTPIIEDLNKEVLSKSPKISTVILIADHESGESRFYSTGFPEVQASMIQMLIKKDKVLSDHLLINVLEQGRVS